MSETKCKLCTKSFTNVDDLVRHIEREHAEQIPKNMSAGQYYYFLKTGKSHGSCVICKGATEWNPKTFKYHRFCKNPKCKEEYRKIFKNRMIGKYGKISLLDDPNQQKKMLANRSISGTYKWSDGSLKSYTGSYELDFLKYLDLMLDFNSDDVVTPSPHTYYYVYEGKKHFYIPDVFIPSLNLEIEIKDGGDNPNMHHKIQDVDKVKEKLKDEVMKSNSNNFNYLKVVNKDNKAFLNYLMVSKEKFNRGDNSPIFMI